MLSDSRVKSPDIRYRNGISYTISIQSISDIGHLCVPSRGEDKSLVVDPLVMFAGFDIQYLYDTE